MSLKCVITNRVGQKITELLLPVSSVEPPDYLIWGSEIFQHFAVAKGIDAPDEYRQTYANAHVIDLPPLVKP